MKASYAMPSFHFNDMGNFEHKEFAESNFEGQIYDMDTALQVADFVLVAGMTLIVMLIAVMLKGRKRFSQNVLTTFFAFSFFFLLYYYSFIHRSAVLAGIAVLFGYGMGFALGPLIYAYIKSLIFQTDKVKKELRKRLIPFGTYWLLFSVPLAINLISGSFFVEYGQWISDTSDYFNIFENLFLIGYCILSMKLLQRIDGMVKNQYADIDSKDLHWIQNLIKGITAIIAFDILLSIYELTYPPTEVIWNVGLFIAFSLIVLIGYLAYRGAYQSRILLPDFIKVTQEYPSYTDKDKQIKPLNDAYQLLSERDAKEIEVELKHLLAEEKPYLNEDLTLSELASSLNLTDKKVSELLNKHMKTNFYELINSYRIESVKEKMEDPYYQKLTILAMAYDSGFKSKTGFNRVFKASTGLTPSAYKKSREMAQKASA